MESTDENGSSLLDVGALRQLFLQLERTDIDELEFVYGSSRLYLRREPGRRAVTAGPGGGASVQETNGVAINAPLGGVFYLRSGPDQSPYIGVGDQVEIGQIVALIETMKLYNEVTADIAGEVLAIQARDGDIVDAGQPLIYILPREEGVLK